MTARSKLVNLDAMVRRADFALKDADQDVSYEKIQTIGLRDLVPDSPLLISLRKPDFQRETNHWTPEQVASLLQCFVDGDLIPSVILWKSPSYLFVIDGGHRLSALRAWVEDDYGDGPTSNQFFGNTPSKEQLTAAKRTRELVNNNIGAWAHLQLQLKLQGTPTPETLRKVQTVSSRALAIQWVQGNADKAESSFFKINTKGTALDDVEQLLLSNRRKPIAIAARAIIRSGMGHKYWSGMNAENQVQIEQHAKKLHQTLFEPELSAPIKTLDLPLGGSKGVRTALEVLIEFLLFATQNQQGNPAKISDESDDLSGDATVEVLRDGLRLAERITGNDRGSLGLHPAIYFYGPSGRHSNPMFLGTVQMFAQELSSNNKRFFVNFTEQREQIEAVLIHHKDLIATILQKTISTRRVRVYAGLLRKTITRLGQKEAVDESTLVADSNLVGKIFVGRDADYSRDFSDDTKNVVFIQQALATALKCPICRGYLDPSKSISYDHIVRKSEGGSGDPKNAQLTHPFCNQGMKH